jgi:hypothetical protein
MDQTLSTQQNKFQFLSQLIILHASYITNPPERLTLFIIVIVLSPNVHHSL